MTSHSTTIAWKIPWTEEPGRLQSMGSLGVGHDFLFCTESDTTEVTQQQQQQCIYVEKAVAPPSSTIAWKIPWTEEPGRLQSMGSLRVRHNWATSLSLFTFMHWSRKWQPTPVFLPGESQKRGSLVGCCLWVAQSRTRLKRLSSSSSVYMWIPTFQFIPPLLSPLGVHVFVLCICVSVSVLQIKSSVPFF